VTLRSHAAAAAWREALADLAADPRFAGHSLAPQVGLVPLRRDPESGLWEFWVALSGSRPERGPGAADGDAARDDTGLEMVLVPPGAIRIGFPTATEIPVTGVENTIEHRLEAPLLVSKFEVTQGQFLEVMGRNPSQHHAGFVSAPKPGDPPRRTFTVTARHPVESVTWHDAAAFVQRLGLELPRQGDWEYFARAGANGAVWWHPDPELAAGELIARADDPRLLALVAGISSRENVGDRAMEEIQGASPLVAEDDGFGLYDILGNVCEWCVDEVEIRGLKLKKRELRGGHWLVREVPHLLLSRSYNDNPAVTNQARGLRPVRPFTAPASSPPPSAAR
jgi:formylglycine-generating enzyme required for sulfatase activity